MMRSAHPFTMPNSRDSWQSFEIAEKDLRSQHERVGIALSDLRRGRTEQPRAVFSPLLVLFAPNENASL